ncbi:MAG: phosphoribosylformylglycinamidine synthase subunit PurL [Pseudanabaenaceae cyanobacterium bins.68]|nr:phosphoribosylformylglycinamidine synthase subunit PurL [Pseudanabaenaceae cyanobacterium bins.68]
MVFSEAEIRAEGLTLAEYEMVCDRLGREPNQAELGMFGVMWSEHCCYKNSRPLLKQFPTEGDRILVGPGENAGVVKVSDRFSVCFKIESHNRPSAVEPFQGAATGVGGILRDIFTMGARPIAILNSLRFGDLSDTWGRDRLRGIVAGIAGYGNCVGVPTVGGETYFDSVYNRNPLVNAMAIGVLETTEIVKSGASGIGNPVLYVGSTTGRDGIKGASFASAELSDRSSENRPAVQVGDPFLEKLLIEACLAAFKTGAVVAAQDMGAAGLTCSTAEMAAKGGVGIELDLDLIPARAKEMTTYEYLLSESQERMLFVAEAGREQELIEIFHRWGLAAVVAGRVIEPEIVRILHHGQVAVEIPARALAENTPIYRRELADTPAYAQVAWQWQEQSLEDFPPPNQVLLRLLDQPAIASKAWIYGQYDHQVQNNTVLLPGGGDAAVLRLRNQDFGVGELEDLDLGDRLGIAATTDCNSRYVYLNPYEGAKLAVAEAARNLACVGAEAIAVTDNLNFGSPETAVGYWQLHEACRGIAAACRTLNTPVTGGNVSLYNETITSAGTSQAIYPTPVIGMIGIVPDLSQVVGMAWQTIGDRIYVLGNLSGSLAGSEYLATIHGLVSGNPAPVDFELEQQVQLVCRTGIQAGWIKSAHDCAEGGLAIALAECCISAGLSAEVCLPELEPGELGLNQLLFGEAPSRIVVSVPEALAPDWERYLRANLPEHFSHIGIISSGTTRLAIAVGQLVPIDLELTTITQTYNQAISRRLNEG